MASATLHHIEHNPTVQVCHLYALLQIEVQHLTTHKVVVFVPHGLEDVLLVCAVCLVLLFLFSSTCFGDSWSSGMDAFSGMRG